jgi:hypothetical protein
MLEINESESFKATGHFSDGGARQLTDEVTWLSSNPNVARIVSGGFLTALRAGKTEVSASKDGITSNIANVTVEEPTVEVDNITVSSGSDDFCLDDAAQGAPPRPECIFNGDNNKLKVEDGTFEETIFESVMVTLPNGSTENVISRVKWVLKNLTHPSMVDILDYENNDKNKLALLFRCVGQMTILVELDGETIMELFVDVVNVIDIYDRNLEDPVNCEGEGTTTGTDNGTGTSTDTGIDNGTGTSTDTGIDNGTGTSTDTGIDNGTGTSTDTGIDNGTGTSTDTGIDNGTGTSTDTGG